MRLKRVVHYFSLEIDISYENIEKSKFFSILLGVVSWYEIALSMR